ncbi:MAG: hypothetical protein ABW178_07360 [Pseudoxanthomonas sp.]
MLIFVNLLILLLPVAMIGNVIYVIELKELLRAMEREFHGVWLQLGSPRMGHATRTVVMPILKGRFAAAAQLDMQQQARCDRLRVYLVVLLMYWVMATPIFLFTAYRDYSPAVVSQ